MGWSMCLKVVAMAMTGASARDTAGESYERARRPFPILVGVQ